MQDGSWGQALTELAQDAVAALVRFWKQIVVQVGLTLGVFLALALPLLLVILLLWYLDSTGWRPASGYYKIGMARESLGPQAAPRVAGLMFGRAEGSSARKSLPDDAVKPPDLAA